MREKANVDELALIEKAHVLRQEDRSAWHCFLRQDSLSVTKPVVRAVEPQWRENVTMESEDLPEVHFASNNPRSSLLQIEPSESEKIQRLPSQLSVGIEDTSFGQKKEQSTLIPTSDPPARLATDEPLARTAAEKLPTRIADLTEPIPYIAPNTSRKPTGAPEVSPALPSKKAWETGRY